MALVDQTGQLRVLPPPYQSWQQPLVSPVSGHVVATVGKNGNIVALGEDGGYQWSGMESRLLRPVESPQSTDNYVHSDRLKAVALAADGTVFALDF